MKTDFEKFILVQKAYPGTKSGPETEYANFVYHCLHPMKLMPKIDPKDVIDLLLPAIKNQIMVRDKADWSPRWKMLSTWTNNRCWEQVQAVGVAEETTKETLARMRAENKL